MFAADVFDAQRTGDRLAVARGPASRKDLLADAVHADRTFFPPVAVDVVKTDDLVAGPGRSCCWP